MILICFWVRYSILWECTWLIQMNGITLSILIIRVVNAHARTRSHARTSEIECNLMRSCVRKKGFDTFSKNLLKKIQIFHYLLKKNSLQDRFFVELLLKKNPFFSELSRIFFNNSNEKKTYLNSFFFRKIS